uniref:Uncharacterized protein n=1 Tax=Rhizophora mucronata TaxID=61149 RepID=A0A2P2Q145_RHIMU
MTWLLMGVYILDTSLLTFKSKTLVVLTFPHLLNCILQDQVYLEVTVLV